MSNELTKEQIKFLNRCTEGTWTYDAETGLVDVDGDFDCSERGLENFRGIKFGKVSGYFYCNSNKLTSLEGAPQEVGGTFDFRGNKLTTLEGSPKKVGGRFDCDYNNLTTLEGAPQVVGRDFTCYVNKLTTLEGAPQVVGGAFQCSKNNLTSLEGAPQKVGRFFSCDAFSLDMDRGDEWNLEGWLSAWKKRPEAQKLILTIMTPEVLNKEIQKDPAGMVMKLKGVWNDESFKEIRDQLVWPKGYEDQADLVGDLDDLGL